MERTSIPTRIMVASARHIEDIHLIDGLPDASSLTDYFEDIPLVTEKAELTEESEETDQGLLQNFRLRANIYRDGYIHHKYMTAELLIYIETLDRSAYLLGVEDNYVRLSYAARSGAAVADTNETTLEMSYSRPYTP